jgi:hypothetical protein
MESDLELKRRVARAVAVFAVAIGMGHVVQTMSERNKIAAEQAIIAAQPKAIVPVAAGPEGEAANRPATAILPGPQTAAIQSADMTKNATDAGVLPKPSQASLVPGLGNSTLSDPQPVTETAMGTPETPVVPKSAVPELVLLAPKTVVTESQPGRIVVASVEPKASIVPKSMEPLLTPDTACQQEMDLTAVSDAMIEIALTAPCHTNERLVVRHEGLAVTVKSTASGSAFVQIPALVSTGNVVLRFADGTEIEGKVDVPGMTDLRRFAVEWMADDTFAVHAFENGAGYGEPGHISAADPGRLPLDEKPKGGYLMILGDDDVVQPLLAEVYTYPRGVLSPVEVSVEAEVTKATCGRELLGDAISSSDGKATLSDLTLAMPDCTALGDILVLKDLVSDMTTLVAAN